MKKYSLIIIMFCICFQANAASADSLELVKVEQRVKKIEDDQALFQQKVDLAIDKVKTNFSQWAILGMLLGSSFILGIGWITLSSHFKKKLNKLTEEIDTKIEQTLAVKLKEKDALIQKMIADADVENRLLNDKKIHIVGESNTETINKVLRKVGYNMRNIVDKEYDLLLINNDKGEFFAGVGRQDSFETKQQKAQVLIDLIKKQNDKIGILYYTSKGIHFPSDIPDFKDYLDKINFATNPAQIYGNLLNSLKYQDKAA